MICTFFSFNFFLNLEMLQKPLIPKYFGAYRDGTNVSMVVLERLKMNLDEYFESSERDFADVAAKLVGIFIESSL